MDPRHLTPPQVPPPGTAAEQGRCEPVSRLATDGEAFVQAVAEGFKPPPMPPGLREKMQRRREDPVGAENPYAEVAGWALYRALDQVRRMPVSRPPTAEQLLAAALVYTACGVPVFPCAGYTKKPATIHGYKNAEVSEEEITRDRWRPRRGPRNIAMPTGSHTADLLDVDVRANGNGWAAASRLRDAGMLTGAMASIGTRWPGGRHLYFAGTWQSCGRLKAHHLDFKSGGGYALLPPSFVTGDDGVSGEYEVIDLRPPTGATLDWEAAKRLLVPPRPAPVRGYGPQRGGRVDHLPDWVAQQPEGNRNAGLFWAACRAAEAGDQEVLAELAGAAVQAGLDEAEAQRTIASAVRTVNGGG
jgi:bifunctional DNA primase/polymerase-like protein